MGTWFSQKQNEESNKAEPEPKANEPDDEQGNVINRDTTPTVDKEHESRIMFMKHQMQIHMNANVEKIRELALTPEDYSAYAPYKFTPCPLPKDAEGYVRSFAADDEVGIRNFFQRYGVVVVRGVLTAAEIQRGQTELWDLVERHCPSVNRSDPNTWKNFPSLSKLGMVGDIPVLSPQFCENRQNPSIHKAFATVIGTPNLMVNVGRASLMRPTRRVKGLVRDDDESATASPKDDDATSDTPAAAAAAADTSAAAAAAATTSEAAPPAVPMADMPEWKTAPPLRWIHWDMNPFTGSTTTYGWRIVDAQLNRGYDIERVQGFVSLCDCGPDDGGFFCVPGGHANLRGWAHEALQRDPALMKRVQNPDSAMQLYVPKGDPLREHAEKCPVRAGCLVIWSSKLPHCNFPNDSDRPRMIQYIKMASTADPAIAPLFARKELLPPRDSFRLTPLGEKLYGFAPW